MAIAVWQSEATAARRRMFFHCVDATDGITAEPGEAGGQPQISTNGGSWGNTSNTLTAIGSGRYYVELTAAEVATAGIIEGRYKSANTAETLGSTIQVIPVDTNIWHVAKTGNDGNTGHEAKDALLTIGQAISSASSGDVIYIWPGNYAETGLDASAKELSFIGVVPDRVSSKITAATGYGIKLDDNSTLKNMAVYAEQVASDAYAVHFGTKKNVVVDNCDIYGGFDGIYCYSSEDCQVRDSRVRSKYDGMNFGGAQKNLICENTIFVTLGTYSTTVYCHAVVGAGYATFNNCIFSAYRNDSSVYHLYAVDIGSKARVAINGGVIRASCGVNASGNVHGVYVNSSDAMVSLNGVSIIADTLGGGDVFDLANDAGLLAVAGCSYDTTQTTGTITQGGSGLEAAVNAQADTALTDYDGPTRAEATTDKNSVITEVNANETKIDIVIGQLPEAQKG